MPVYLSVLWTVDASIFREIPGTQDPRIAYKMFFFCFCIVHTCTNTRTLKHAQLTQPTAELATNIPHSNIIVAIVIVLSHIIVIVVVVVAEYICKGSSSRRIISRDGPTVTVSDE